MQTVADQTGCLSNIRAIGAMVAAELKPHPEIPRLGYAVHQQALTLGALIRPLGHTLYWLPPLNVADQTLAELQDITIKALQKVYAN